MLRLAEPDDLLLDISAMSGLLDQVRPERHLCSTLARNL
jgi:hypothetical protein